MLVQTLNGNCVKWKLEDQVVHTNKSSFHLKTREILKERFPTHQILEEVSIPILPKLNLYLDFFLPLRKLAVEVQGQQHFTFNPFFHKTQAQFRQQLKNDRIKKEWCDLNNIELLVFSFEDEDHWTEILS